MQTNTLLAVLLPLAGASIGFAAQQAVEFWKTSRSHRYELQRRFFDVKLQTAIDVVKALNTVLAVSQARLVEAEEWTHEDERFGDLAGVQHVLQLHAQTLEKEFDRFHTAQAMMDLVFPSSTMETSGRPPIAAELNQAWGVFENSRRELIERLQALQTEERAEELRQQRSRGHFEPGVHQELEAWIAEYKSGVSQLRSMLPRLRELTASTEQAVREAVRAIRKALQPYVA